ncbi:hypothetical protein [Vibrio parahaemolyticus]|uniref:hypothetical protein n=1 Tax=Vibrio parahaemolyticus TaxID=670 RepID=UPI00235ED208|nr:hypothetical protein [Vibrio parahaemolyticus]
MAKSKSKTNRDYYQKNKERLLEKAKSASKKAAANKTFSVLLQELADARVKAEAKMLHETLTALNSNRDNKITPNHLALLWQQFVNEKKLKVKISNASDFKQPFAQWLVEKV